MTYYIVFLVHYNMNSDPFIIQIYDEVVVIRRYL